MSKAIITKDDMALLKEASEMFNETGCVPGIDGEQVPAEKMVPDVKEYTFETAGLGEGVFFRGARVPLRFSARCDSEICIARTPGSVTSRHIARN